MVSEKGIKHNLHCGSIKISNVDIMPHLLESCTCATCTTSHGTGITLCTLYASYEGIVGALTCSAQYGPRGGCEIAVTTLP